MIFRTFQSSVFKLLVSTFSMAYFMKINCIEIAVMKIISTKLHGVLDYLVGFISIISPWLFGFANGGPEMWIPIILGIGAFLYSIITRYELSIFKIISFKTHLIIDSLSGIFFVVSPWLLGFADNIYVPHVLFGLLELVVVILTRTNTSVKFKNVKQSAA